ncbi:MAG: hypothetical protein ACLUB5_02430 [Bifidobacterium dentium]
MIVDNTVPTPYLLRPIEFGAVQSPFNAYLQLIGLETCGAWQKWRPRTPLQTSTVGASSRRNYAALVRPTTVSINIAERYRRNPVYGGR